ncbi:MAG: NAD(P)-dependent oxidoreductase [Candidatus Bathyarchaeia archaeon]|jgi:UDP-glucose 4-epimerase
MLKNVLVTGHTGLIGRHLFEKLRATGVEVEGISGNNHSGGVLNKEFIQSRIAGKDTVFHLAANAYIWLAQTQPAQDCELNVIGSLNVIEGCMKSGAKLIFPSTIHVYAIPEQEGSVLSESSKLEPVEFYGVGKLAVENYIRVFNRQSSLRGIVLRLPWVYSKDLRRRRGLLADLAYADSLPVHLHHAFRDIFDYVHVDDVVRAMMIAAESPVDFGIFNISSGKAVTCRQVVELFGKDAVEASSHRNHRAVLDNSLARQVLGWQPEHDFLTDFKTLMSSWRQVKSSRT